MASIWTPTSVSVRPFSTKVTIESQANNINFSEAKLALKCQATSEWLEPTTDFDELNVPLSFESKQFQGGITVVTIANFETLNLVNKFSGFKYRNKSCSSEFFIVIKDFAKEHIQSVLGITSDKSMTDVTDFYRSALPLITLKPAYSQYDNWGRFNGCENSGSNSKCRFYLYANAFYNGAIFRRGWDSLTVTDLKENVFPVVEYPLYDYVNR